MNVAELIAEVECQLDSGADKVSFSRDDAMSLLSRLTAFKNLVDKGEDKSVAQIAAIQAQRADQWERKANQMRDVLDRIRDSINAVSPKKPPSHDC